MEPRQQWRGNKKLKKSWMTPLTASMEPRQQWRGNKIEKKLDDPIDSFNGAAPTMARKHHAACLQPREDLTASMEPRQQWRGNPPFAPHPVPQHRASMEPRQQWRGNRSACELE